MPQQIKQCAWEIYLRNMAGIYKNAGICFGIQYAFSFMLSQVPGKPLLKMLMGMLWLIALAPLDLWWRKSLLDLVKGEQAAPRGCLSLYGNDPLCRKSIFLQLLCQGAGFWFWGIGTGIHSAAEGNAAVGFLGICVSLLCRLTPFFLALAVQPVYVNLLIAPHTPLFRHLSKSWTAMTDQRGDLARLWLSLGGWLALLLCSDLLALAAGSGAVSFLFWLIRGLACVALAPYVTLCGIFFSLRIIHKDG